MAKRHLVVDNEVRKEDDRDSLLVLEVGFHEDCHLEVDNVFGEIHWASE